MRTINLHSWLLLAFILLKFALQYLLLGSEYDLQRDEYLHLDQAHHLAWGFQSVPPFSSWIAKLILWLGNSVFWIKFFPALFGAMTIVVVWKTIETLGGKTFALVLGASCVLLSALLRLNMLFQPNSFDVLSWTLVYFFALKFAKTASIKWLYYLAISAAVGLLNKYNVAFLLIGLIPAILLSPHRKVFLNKHLYVAAGLALLMLLPNIWWQISHDFPVVSHMNELAETQLVNVNRLDFLKAQTLFFLGGLFVLIFSFIGLLAFKPFRPFRFFFVAFTITLSAFIYLRAKDYYAIGLYPIFIGFGAVYLEYLLEKGWLRYLKIAAVSIPILLFVPVYEVAFPNKNPEQIIANPEPYEKLGMLRWEDGENHALPQDFADMLGWKELANLLDSVYQNTVNQEQTLIMCDNYGEAGAINYYAQSQGLIASSFNADYKDWLDLDQEYQNVILVKEPGGENPLETPMVQYFDTVYLAGVRVNQFAREDSISVYLLLGAKLNVSDYLRRKIEEEKQHL